MYVANWFHIKEEFPSTSGDYSINLHNKIYPAVYLKKGESFILKTGCNECDSVENRLLFFLGPQERVITVPETGFYQKTEECGNECLSLIQDEDMKWTPSPITNGFYNENQLRLKEINENVPNLSDVTLQIKEYEREEPFLTKIKKEVLQSMPCEELENPDMITEYGLRGFLDALKIRKLIKMIPLFPYAEELCIKTLLEDVPVTDCNRLIFLKEKFYEFLLLNGANAKHARDISDACFLEVILPTNKEQMNAITESIACLNRYYDKDTLSSMIYHEYIYLLNIRAMLCVYMDKGISRDCILDGIALKKLAISIGLCSKPYQ